MAWRSMGADFINHSFAPEVTLAREIGACITNISFVTAAFQSYFAPAGVKILGDDPYKVLGPLASKLALMVLAALPLEAGCGCAGLRSEQPPEHYARR
ncbi:hypothetical protein [Pseudogemmobacter humi]|uniref:Uncharacterized protein n=1 Tax=Pseudogemmobacter humi TaxID=2483812 RepID=A0A3P5WKE4_9RHOB|nr:hypothetical protein [Pseudogemmobacter humi]VDC19940.1 hypothetical protein XINFAN_00327 [Pseudogemmobacter humi]